MSVFLFADDQDAAGKVNIDELYERNHRRNIKQISIFNKILNRIHNRIKVTAANKFNDDKHIWYSIPAFIFGEPVYDQSSCIAFVITKLEENGFHIKYVHPGTLFVSWDNWVPNYARQEIRKRTGIVLDSHGNVVKEAGEEESSSIPVNNVAAATAVKKPGPVYKSISEYKPTGNLVYGKEMLESLDKKVRFV
jgi:hypothetical protein